MKGIEGSISLKQGSSNKPSRQLAILDGNAAAAHIAYLTNEVLVIYPITPSSPMGELSDQWASQDRKNIWGEVVQVVEMQSEAGAAGAIHGSLQAGALTSTFTASQGLLLMIPNMYKIAGELTPAVFHVAARSLAAQALSIFGDHSDVMAARQTGFAMLCSANVQESMDFALVSQMATLESRIPFLHFFDGFRTSHELSKVEVIQENVVRELINDGLVRAHRDRRLTPDKPVIRGTAQNPDVYFQARESVNPWYLACPEIVAQSFARFASLTGRSYAPFEYYGHPEASTVLVLMGSGVDTVCETVDRLNNLGYKVGVVKVRLYRPFDCRRFIEALPKGIAQIAVLDRTKEPGSAGEPLYQDVLTAVFEGQASENPKFSTLPKILGGRYGLSSKEFTPAMVKAVVDNALSSESLNHFTVGINDDLTHTSLSWDKSFSLQDAGSVQAGGKKTIAAVIYGLGSDGTVGANKNTIKIIGEETDNFVQGYFVYDSKKSGSITISHLRFGPDPIRSSYLVDSADFIGCNHFSFLSQIDMLSSAKEGAVFLLNCPYSVEEVWETLPREAQEYIVKRRLQFYIIDAHKIAKDVGLGRRVNTIFQTCFFAISGVLPQEEAIDKIKKAISKTYGRRGEVIVEMNHRAVDETLNYLKRVTVPAEVTSKTSREKILDQRVPSFVQDVTFKIMERLGDDLPVSALPVDGTWPTATAKWEKRAIATDVPIWDPDVCIQCGKCVLVCPHSVIRSKIYDENELKSAPSQFRHTGAKWRDYRTQRFTIQVSADDCTGCALCVEACPAKNKSNTSLKAINMQPLESHQREENENWDFFLELPQMEQTEIGARNVKDIQLLEPLFEFSGACAGCGETPYLKMLSQLFGDRAIIANATGCSSIYGGNLPTTPWTVNKEGRGPAWANSLFEDNAEFGLGMRLALDTQISYASNLLCQLSGIVGEELVTALLNSGQADDSEIAEQRKRVEAVKGILSDEKYRTNPLALELLNIADVLVKKSVWIIGGDGWAYDIGYGGLDHVLASGRNVTILVLDTEVYSNTGGQKSKSTPRGAVAKFAMAGKKLPKKDLALLALTYGEVYVARVALGGDAPQTIKALQEAERWPGPSLVLAYSHCIAHGYDLLHGMSQQSLAVQSGYWPLFRYNPALRAPGENPFSLDSKPPSIPLKAYAYNEARYNVLVHTNPDAAEELMREAQADVKMRWATYEHIAEIFKTSAQLEEPENKTEES